MTTRISAIIFRIRAFVVYFCRAKTKYDVHSPLVFDFVCNVLEDHKRYYCFEEIEQHRSALLHNDTSIAVTDYGAGSQVISTNVRKVKDIAASSLSKPYFCQLLFRLAHWLKPQNVVELGTSLGVSTLYLSKASRQSKITTIEGSHEIAGMATQYFNLSRQENIQIVCGDFDSILKNTLAGIGVIQLFVIDGNHRRDATLRNFAKCLEAADSKAVFVFDDIYWSTEMAEAWAIIKSHPKTRLSIDIFQFGLVFLHDDIFEKQHFTLIDSKYKRWRTGLFA